MAMAGKTRNVNLWAGRQNVPRGETKASAGKSAEAFGFFFGVSPEADTDGKMPPLRPSSFVTRPDRARETAATR